MRFSSPTTTKSRSSDIVELDGAVPRTPRGTLKPPLRGLAVALDSKRVQNSLFRSGWK